MLKFFIILAAMRMAQAGSSRTPTATRYPERSVQACTRRRWNSPPCPITARCAAVLREDADYVEPLAALALTAAPAVVSFASGEPWFVAVLLPLLALALNVQAPPAAALIVATILFDAGACLFNEPPGPLVANTAFNVVAAALSVRITADAQQDLASEQPRPALPPRPRAAAMATQRKPHAEDDVLSGARREALRLRRSWDARLQWRLRKRAAAASGNTTRV